MACAFDSITAFKLPITISHWNIKYATALMICCGNIKLLYTTGKPTALYKALHINIDCGFATGVFETQFEKLR